MPSLSLDCGDIIWGYRGNTSLMSELQVLQNKAARVILDLSAHSSATEGLKMLGWWPLMRRRLEYRAASFINYSTTISAMRYQSHLMAIFNCQ